MELLVNQNYKEEEHTKIPGIIEFIGSEAEDSKCMDPLDTAIDVVNSESELLLSPAHINVAKFPPSFVDIFSIKG